jgi:plasmid stabilization system protein ParE
MKFEVRPAAQEDADRETLHYDRQRYGLGDDFLDDLEDAYQVILRQPQSFGRVWQGRRNREIRQYVMKIFPYSVVYELLPGQIEILAVIHHSRGPGYWRRRLAP